MITPLLFPGFFFSGRDDDKTKVDKDDVIAFFNSELQMTPIFVTFRNTSTLENLYTVLEREHYVLDVLIPLSSRNGDECRAFEDGVDFLNRNKQEYKLDTDSHGYNWIYAKITSTEMFLQLFELLFRSLETDAAFIYDEIDGHDTETFIHYMLQSYCYSEKKVGFIRMKNLCDYIDHNSDTVLPWYRYDIKLPDEVAKVRKYFEVMIKDTDEPIISEALWRVLSNHSYI